MLEEVKMPDGRTACVTPVDPVEPKGKFKESESRKEDISGVGGPLLTASVTARPHCSKCCPSAPRDSAGVPLEGCAHQSDLPGARVVKDSKETTKLKKGPPAPAAIPLPGSEAELVEQEQDTTLVGGRPLPSGGKLKKKGGELPPDEMLDESRRLASEFYTVQITGSADI